MDEDVCRYCGDLKDDVGNCYTCSDQHIELRKDFVWEYSHESVTERGSQFRRIMPKYD